MIEALVAIGAMALVAVGIAAIFQSVGKTVAGGRRLSVLNGYAAMLEQQMRSEFARMSRDGFLVIRNQYADVNGDKNFDAVADVVSRSTVDPSPRPRRIDEVMFIAKGDFTSAREPLDADYIARSEYARVYFGHGLRLPASAAQNAYVRPETDNSNILAPRFGRPGAGGGAGVNQFAKDWTLLRHATLLVRPQTTTPSLPEHPVFNWNPLPPGGGGAQTLNDKEGQVSLQPAAASLFRSIARLKPPLIKVNTFVRGNEQKLPAFSSGIVDIACNDLSDVRGVIYGMSQAPNMLTQYGNYPPRTGGFAGWEFVPGSSKEALAKQWMDECWPTLSDQTASTADAGTRIRCEPGPTDYITTIASAGTGNAVEAAFRRADQLMLASSNFIPGCTEFIVEYSFGVTDPNTGRLLWHGLERRADTNGDGALTTADAYVVRPYPVAPDGASANSKTNGTWYRMEYRDQTGAWHSDDKTLLPKPVADSFPVPASLFAWGTANGLIRTSYFGYVDPSATGTSDIGRPWAWPTLIRVTMSLTDPASPTSEETFQFVFPTAGNPT